MSKRSKSSNANNQDDSKERPNFTPDMRRAPRVSPVKLLKFNFNNVMSNLLTNRNGQTQQSNSREKSRLYLNKEGKNIDIRSKIMINSIEA
jgi:hypothetical protein